MSEYSNFEFEIGKPNGNYRARVIESSVGDGQECQFSWPTLDADLSNLLQVLRDSTFSRSQSRSAAVSVGNPVVPDIRHLAIGHEESDLPEARLVARRTLEDFGRQLFDRVFAGTVREALRSSAEKAKDQGLRLRIRLRLDNVPEFHDVPWEYLFDTSPPGEFMLHWKERSLVRYLSLPNPIRPLTLETELRVLVMISSPAGVTPLNVEDEWTKLQGALNTPGSQRIALDRLENATLSALQKRLRDQSYHAFHFIGHGGFEDDEGILLLEDSNGEKRAVRADQIGAILRNHESLRLVVLNACEGARTSNHDPFAGVAQRLVGLGVPVVVAMQYEISDQAAITFSSNLYAVLAKGYSVDAAMTEARLAIFTGTDSEFEFGIPVLHMRLEDGQLFTLMTQGPGAPATASLATIDPAGLPDPVAMVPPVGSIPSDVQLDSVRQALALLQLTNVSNISNGPKVNVLWFSFDLIRVFSDQAGNRILATQLLNTANEMVAKAVPVADQERFIITPGQTPGFHQADSFWTEILYMAAAKGPKLTASLILCLPIDAFPPSTLKLRQRLLESLMAGTAHVFTPA